MRSSILVVLALAVLILGFLLYQKVVSKPAVAGSDDLSSHKAPKQDLTKGLESLHRGNNAVYAVRDEIGRLKNEFRAAEYIPKPDGKIGVIDPDAWFYMPN